MDTCIYPQKMERSPVDAINRDVDTTPKYVEAAN